MEGPTTWTQEELCFLDTQLGPCAALNLSHLVLLDGPLDTDALADAVRSAFARHEVFRTAFQPIGGASYKARVLPPRSYSLDVIDVRVLHDSIAAVQAVVAHYSSPFLKSAGYLSRAALARLDGSTWLLFVASHHLCADAWTMQMICGDISAAYCDLIGVPYSKCADPGSCIRQAKLQRDWLSSSGAQSELDWWRRYLRSIKRCRSDTNQHRRGLNNRQVTLQLSRPRTRMLHGIACRYGTTLFALLLTAFADALRTSCGHRRLLIGTLASGRQLPGDWDVAGAFYNKVVLRLQSVELSSVSACDRAIALTHQAVTNVLAHQGLPATIVQEMAGLDLGIDLQACLDAMFVFDSHPLHHLRLPGIDLCDVSSHPMFRSSTARFRTTRLDPVQEMPPVLHIRELEGHCQCTLQFSGSKGGRGDAVQILRSFCGSVAKLEQLLETACQQEGSPQSSIPDMSARSRP